MKTSASIIICLLTFSLARSQHVPSIEEVISLRNVGNVQLSPDGKAVAYTVQTTDWNDNRYDTEIWMYREGGKPFQLTHNPKNSSTGPLFSPDGQWLAFLSDRGNKNQIYVLGVNGGEARAITREEEGIAFYEWHPDGKRLVFIKAEKDDKAKKEREKRYGAFEADDKEFTLSHLWQIDFNPDMQDPTERPCYETVDSLKVKAGCIEWPKAKRITEGKFTVTGFSVSPDGTKIAFSHQPDPLINSFVKSDISVVDIATKKVTPVVTNPSGDSFEDWSPDSKELLYTTNLNDTVSNFYTNSKLFAIHLETKTTRQLAKDLDEDLGGFSWESTGIYSALFMKTARHLYRIDPTSGSHAIVKKSPEQILGFSFSKDGQSLAFVGRNGDQLNEVFLGSVNGSATAVTNMTDQIKDWKTAQSEVINWKSKDGATIEGVLHKPKNYDPSKKYPLLVMIHGGPTGIDTPNPVPGSVYPVLQWLDKGCLVLRPNYRGSAGYGEAFRSLNVKNLGAGDMWDVMSGIDYLDKKGMIDKTKMGSMGWSQGGYISAFLTTNTNVFKAISVGAGISNWVTYYVSTDIHPFTRQYLKATPWSDEMIYKKTSPMTNINNAKTPTLIQHGELDRRVPISNAYELLQGLRDKNVPAELIVYKGFGHGISKPKERLAANWHNWQWFNKYVWGEKVELPVGEGKK
ncbi:MAG: S9 family peptidase [Bacteroidota bacterium]|jgi:dipeptidyl aminopeptidase/acylaminoacyl peptidase|nr:S9 family peptidase [Cytophagales bacterium]MCE2956787.1 S9 family peptidase [Flammeovirgaceae bacterium]MCZ8069156.1 S9 family peptidase [Cytophagales bacterium]